MKILKGLCIPVLLLAVGTSLHAEEASLMPKPGEDPAQMLGGDEGEACKMLVCLSNPIGSDLAECSASLKKYFDMKPHKRPGYLEKCPKQQ